MIISGHDALIASSVVFDESAWLTMCLYIEIIFSSKRLVHALLRFCQIFLKKTLICVQGIEAERAERESKSRINWSCVEDQAEKSLWRRSLKLARVGQSLCTCTKTSKFDLFFNLFIDTVFLTLPKQIPRKRQHLWRYWALIRDSKMGLLCYYYIRQSWSLINKKLSCSQGTKITLINRHHMYGEQNISLAMTAIQYKNSIGTRDFSYRKYCES